jgi:tetratricopeptide (TPR) repeat protein
MLKRHKELIFVLLSLLVIFTIYIYTTYPAFKNDDSPETAAASFTLGIGHPPGYPLFTMAAKIFSLLPIGAPAFRVNLFACFIAMLALLIFYFIIKQNMNIIFGEENRILNLLAIFIPAVSYIFWNQAIEAKGGIYLLNILFLSVMIYFYIRQLTEFNLRQLYLIIYIFGLSMANHWPSSIVCMPLLAYLFYKDQNKIKLKTVVFLSMFFLVGISAYLYLPVRSGTPGVFILMAKPDNLRDLLGTILLTGYREAVSPFLNFNAYQIKETLDVIPRNFYLLWPLIFAGLYALWRSNKVILSVYLSLFTFNVLLVTLTLRVDYGYKWAIGNFLMPSMFILAICITAGVYFLARLFTWKIYKNTLTATLGVILLWTGFVQFKANYSRYNYIAYDFVNNIIKTIEPGSIYFMKGDYFGMPFIYMDVIEHKTNDIKHQPIFGLQFKWGISDFIKGFKPISFYDPQFNATFVNLINNLKKINNVYIGGLQLNMDDKIGNYSQRVQGLLVRIANDNEYFDPNVFNIYSYRGVYDNLTLYDKNLVALYRSKMAERALEYAKTNQLDNAIDLYKRVLIMPSDHNDSVYFIDIAIAYKGINNLQNELFYLKKAVISKPDFWQAYEEMGMVYIKTGNLLNAKIAFQNAINHGSQDGQLLGNYIRAIDKRIENIK